MGLSVVGGGGGWWRGLSLGGSDPLAATLSFFFFWHARAHPGRGPAVTVIGDAGVTGGGVTGGGALHSRRGWGRCWYLG